MARTKRTTRTTRKAAAARVLRRLQSLAISRASQAREAITTRAAQARIQTAEAASRFERAFEHRVSQAMSRIGVPTARDVRSLSRQVAQLQQSVDQLRRSRARA